MGANAVWVVKKESGRLESPYITSGMTKLGVNESTPYELHDQDHEKELSELSFTRICCVDSRLAGQWP